MRFQSWATVLANSCSDIEKTHTFELEFLIFSCYFFPGGSVKNYIDTNIFSLQLVQ